MTPQAKGSINGTPLKKTPVNDTLEREIFQNEKVFLNLDNQNFQILDLPYFEIHISN